MYGSSKPATIVTYRGFVGHYNGAQAEWAAKTLDAVAGNFNVKGGTNVKIGGKFKDAYAETAKKNKQHVRKAEKLKIAVIGRSDQPAAPNASAGAAPANG